MSRRRRARAEGEGKGRRMSLEIAKGHIRNRQPEQAIPILTQLVAQAPGDMEAHYWLASSLLGAGKLAEHEIALNDARSIHAFRILRSNGFDVERMKKDPAYALEIGILCYSANVMSASSLAIGLGLDLNNPSPDALLRYGLSLQHQGRLNDARNVYQLMADVFTKSSDVQLNIILHMHDNDRLESVKNSADRWVQGQKRNILKSNLDPSNSKELDRVIRIGYVAPSFLKNQLEHFIRPVIESHDLNSFQVFLYGEGEISNEEIRQYADYTDTSELSNFDLCKRISDQRIDILVDLWGHFAGNRAEIFIMKPAPIQCAWINFVFTTGISEIDYTLHPSEFISESEMMAFKEEVWPIGPISAPFRPYQNRPDVLPTPALKNGFITYGSFNNPIKLSNETIAAWSAILTSRPEDRLLLKYKYFFDPALRRATQARFAAFGVDPEQILFRGHSQVDEYLQEFQDIDLALDPSPCPGGTTSLDAISNGVPVLTQTGRDFYSRIGSYCLLPCGFPELVTEDWSEYVVRALELTSDYAALDALRQRIRPGFEASPYRDEVGFTRRLEGEFRKMLKRWAETAA
jgi:predicted O-linked N-acetylglucosamine transferase (SPINDLY family)